jgi:hypothetical protein
LLIWLLGCTWDSSSKLLLSSNSSGSIGILVAETTKILRSWVSSSSPG